MSAGMSKRAMQLNADIGANMRESLGEDSLAESQGEPVTKLGLIGVSSPRLDVERMKGAIFLPPTKIEADPDQPRKTFGAAELDELATSLRTRGMLQPIRVRWDEEKGVWVIVTGERRWRASLLAGLDKIPAIDASKGAPEDVLADQLVENCLRQDLDPIEQARAIRRLMDQSGWSQARVSSELGLSTGAISKSLRLLDLSPKEQEDVSRGNLTVKDAYGRARMLPDSETAAPDADIREVRKLATRRALKAGRPRTGRFEYQGQEGKVSVVVKNADAGPRDFERVLRAAIADLKKAAS
jgi:ParB family chromosome partitioning protein